MSELTMRPATAEAVWEAYRKQTRFHAVCNSIVAEEMHLARRALDEVEHDPWRVREVCDRIAVGVAARVLQTVYENDAEIAQWKHLAEDMQKAALSAGFLMPMPVLTVKP